MPTYDVTIHVTTARTYHIDAEDHADATEAAHEIASALLEGKSPEDRDEETLATKLVGLVEDSERQEPITESEALELSRQLWEQVAKLPDDEIISSAAKAIALEAMGWEPSDVLNECFACEYTRDDMNEHDCTLCPVPAWRAKTDGDEDATPCIYAEYGAFTDSADTPSQRRAAARKISKLMRTD